MAFRLVLRLGCLSVLLLPGPTSLEAQEISIHGEASLSGLTSNAPGSDEQLLARYIPDVSGGVFSRTSFSLDFDASVNLWVRAHGGGENSGISSDADPYRAWIRFNSDRFELRTGLQKISFGSASVFRSLMWFDRMDPRDPLQLSEGVYAALGRAFLPGNVTLWGWGVLGEDERKGWEIIPSVDGSLEAGGRVQVPLGPGELAVSFHRRAMDVGALLGPGSPGFSEEATESRFALDGKWDLEIGFWLEAMVSRQNAASLQQNWIRSVTVGADYTFAVGNGLGILAEHFWKELPALEAGLGAGIPGDASQAVSDPSDGTVPASRIRITALTSSYPFGVLDRIGLAVYWDWENQELFRMVEWQRTYDRWRIHLLGFWNPESSTLFPGSGVPGATGSGSLAGAGGQLMVVLNH